MKKHWTDQPSHASHVFTADGRCLGCQTHRTWPGATSSCPRAAVANERRKIRARQRARMVAQ